MCARKNESESQSVPVPYICGELNGEFFCDITYTYTHL